VNILIVGAAGNLGSHVTRHLLARAHRLRLLMHKRTLPFELPEDCSTEIVYGDLDQPSSLAGLCRNIDCIVYIAGVLFQPRPKSFLHRTNTIYVENMVNAALSAGVRKFILVSFPHVEENTTPNSPARGVMEASPKSIHARTRLEAEKYLLRACADRAMTPVMLRAGVIYGRGVKLIEAAHWLMKHRLMAIWRKPTWVHLLSLPDFLDCVAIAIERDHLFGVYNICDDQPLLLQEFLDRLAVHWKRAKPWRLPDFMFVAAAAVCESFATVFRTSAPLTLDIVRMGMTSVVADTSRMKQHMMAKLNYPTIDEGLTIL
jgi:nucleoside-diphosphate-sugar epimerase